MFSAGWMSKDKKVERPIGCDLSGQMVKRLRKKLLIEQKDAQMPFYTNFSLYTKLENIVDKILQ